MFLINRMRFKKTRSNRIGSFEEIFIYVEVKRLNLRWKGSSHASQRMTLIRRGLSYA